MKKLLTFTLIGFLIMGCTNQKQEELSKKFVSASKNNVTNIEVKLPLIHQIDTPSDQNDIEPFVKNINKSETQETTDAIKPVESPKPSEVSKPVETPQDITHSEEHSYSKEIAFTIETLEDSTLLKGQKVVEQEGIPGILIITERKTFTNNKLVKSEVLSEVIKQEPVKHIIRIGTQEPTYTITENKAMAKEAFDLINMKRVEAGVKEMVWNEAIYDFALIRAKEIIVSFSHTRLDGRKFYEGSNLVLNGENIAAGQPNANSLVEAWYNSKGHKENMLRDWFKCGAVAVVNTNEGYRTYSVNLFSE